MAYWTLFIIGNTTYFVCQPLLLLKRMIDIIQKQGINPINISDLLQLLVVNLGLTYIFWLCHGPARCVERANAFTARSTYRKFLFCGVMGMPLDWHSQHHSGDTIDKIEKGSQGLYSFASDSFQVIFSVIRLVVSFGMLTYFSHSAGIIVIIMIVITASIINCFDRVILANYKVLNKAENRISEHVFDKISNITTVVILRAEKFVFDTLSKKLDEPFDLYKVTNRINETKWFMVDVCGSFTTAIVLGVYFWQNQWKMDSEIVGKVFILMRYLNEMSDFFFRVADLYGEIIQRFSRVLNSEELSKNFHSKEPVNHKLPVNWGEIEVKNLNFAYTNDDGKLLHLKDISFSIKRGERIVFVGKKGSGKTTTLKVIRDLYNPRSIDLSVDRKTVEEGFKGIGNSTGMVPQKPEIFATTIRENITLGANHSDEKIRTYTDLTCFTEVIKKLPKELESMINEKGVNLSGGQAQSLALTRGLMACEGLPLILLDEPTSSIDMTTEVIIYKRIFEKFNDSTIIISTHQRRLFPLFHRICVFDEGKIVGTGTMRELLSNCPEFRELMEHDEGEEG